jgi:hypothetical protein
VVEKTWLFGLCVTCPLSETWIESMNGVGVCLFWETLIEKEIDGMADI